MKRTIFILFVISALIIQLHGQKNQVKQFKIAFYNTENIFDTIDDPNKSDEDFLPNAKVAWTTERYNTKLHHIAKVIRAIDSVNLPDVVGLAEVENAVVLKELVTKTSLAAGKYSIILEEGSDPRGIDVALIYRNDAMTYLAHKAFKSAQSFDTRNVLYVKMADSRKNIYHIFVNHWKSRSGGAAETEPKRIENASVLKHLVDSVMAQNLEANIVIMGDLNDEPSDKSIAATLGAKKPERKVEKNSLYNLLYDRYASGEGTLYYKDWDLFDQIIVSGNLLNKKPGKGAVILPPYGYVFKQEWMLFKTKSGELTPSRTAGSKEYYGGYSDHLPVYTIVNY